MGEIREELTLFDKFSSTFSRFLNLGNRAVLQSKAVEAATNQVSGSFVGAARGADIFNDSLKSQNLLAQRASGGGLFSLLKRLSSLAAAYFTVQKAAKMVAEAMESQTYEVKLRVIFGDAAGSAAMNWTRQMSSQLGIASDKIAQAAIGFTKVSTKPANLEKFYPNFR